MLDAKNNPFLKNFFRQQTPPIYLELSEKLLGFPQKFKEKYA